MFEDLSDEARQVLDSAQQEARAFGHAFVGTEHLLLALLNDRGVPHRVLQALGVRRQRVEAEVERVIGRGDSEPTGELSFTPAAEGALRRSVAEARDQGHEDARAEDLLLGMSEQSDGLAARILTGMDIAPEQVRLAVAQQG